MDRRQGQLHLKVVRQRRHLAMPRFFTETDDNADEIDNDDNDDAANNHDYVAIPSR